MWPAVTTTSESARVLCLSGADEPAQFRFRNREIIEKITRMPDPVSGGRHVAALRMRRDEIPQHVAGLFEIGGGYLVW